MVIERFFGLELLLTNRAEVDEGVWEVDVFYMVHCIPLGIHHLATKGALEHDWGARQLLAGHIAVEHTPVLHCFRVGTWKCGVKFVGKFCFTLFGIKWVL